MGKPHHLWLAECALCKHVGKKAAMQRLYIERKRYAAPTILCYLCKGCFQAMLETLEISL